MSQQRKQQGRGYGDVSKYSSFELRFEDGPRKGKSYELPEGKTVIGRAEDCDMKIDSDAASRVHACVRRKGINVFISDEGSHNGTFVNDEKITSKTQLSAGDKIHIGGMNLRLVIDGNDERDDSESVGRTGESTLSFGQKLAAFVVMLAIFTSVFLFLLPRFGLVPVLHASLQKAESAIQSLVPADVEADRAPQPSMPFILQSANAPQAIQAAPPPQATAQPSSQNSSVSLSTTPLKTASASQKARSGKRIRSGASSVADEAFEDDEDEDDDGDSQEEAKPDAVPLTRDMRRVRSLYMADKVGEAVDLAEKVGLNAQATQMRRFLKAESEAKSAFAYQRGTEAIKRYEEALAADLAIVGDSQGASVPAKRVKKALSSLYQKAGEAFSTKGNKTRAAELFEKSLEYDATNSRSRKLLASIQATHAKANASSEDTEEDGDDFDESDELDVPDEE